MQFIHSITSSQTLPCMSYKCYCCNQSNLANIYTSLKNGNVPMLLLPYKVLFILSTSLMFHPPKLTFFMLYVQVETRVFIFFFLTWLQVQFISICIPPLIKYSLSTAVSKAVWDISMLPGFTFPGILILLPNRCEKRSCHTLLWWPQWFCALSKSSGFP